MKLPKPSWSTLLWVALFGMLAYRMTPQVAAAFGVGAAGPAAPQFELMALDGTPVSAGDLRGKVVMVNFWATWCPPCRVEMPGFERVYREYADQGFVIVGVSTDRTGREAVREFLAARGITYPVAMATPSVVHDFGGVRALPTSFLIDRSGRVRQQVTGIFAEPALRMAVGRLVAEPHPAPAE